MNITFRLAMPADAVAMADILSSSWTAAYGRFFDPSFIREKNASRFDLYRRIITNDNTSYYIIENNRLATGIMCLAPSKDDDANNDIYELYAIYLRPKYFRRGIGSMALDFAFKKSRSLGKKIMVVWVLAKNINAICFYKKHGFFADGKVGTYDCGKAMEIIRMRKIL